MIVIQNTSPKIGQCTLSNERAEGVNLLYAKEEHVGEVVICHEKRQALAYIVSQF